MKRKLKIIIPILISIVAIVITSIIVIVSIAKKNAEIENSPPPYFVGIKDITIEEGQGIAYRSGVKAYDYKDNEIEFKINSSNVDQSTPGTYYATYIATDKNGKTTKEKITVTVTKKPKIPPEVLYELVDAQIEKYGMKNMSREELCVFLYSHIKQTTTFVNDSDKSDWIAEAYRALTEHKGDCFTYYAVARAFFERCGVEVIEVERTKGARVGTHFWLLVNMGTKNEPLWYHWDCCPHYKEYPIYTCLLTDDELLAYNKKVENYYLFDLDKYPRTPTTPYN